MYILILNGHDYYGNGGATNPKYGTEQDLTRKFSRILKTSFQTAGCEVTIFNPLDTDRSMYTRLTTLNQSYNFDKFDYVIELHFNSYKLDSVGDGIQKGTEILVHNTAKKEVISLADYILESLESQLGIRNRGVKSRSDLYVMNYCKKQGVPYMLWEICFLDDEDDMVFYMENQENIANTFVCSFLNIMPNTQRPTTELANTYIVKLLDSTDTLNLRATKSFKDRNIIAHIPDMTILDIICIEGDWYRIKYNGMVGYVWYEFVVKVRKGIVTADVLNVREQAGAYATNPPIMKLNRGAVCYIFDTTSAGNGETWYLIGNVNRELYGYVHSGYIRIE